MNNPKDHTKRIDCTLSFCGGGILCYSHIQAWCAMRPYLHPLGVGGTSAGALVACMVSLSGEDEHFTPGELASIFVNNLPDKKSLADDTVRSIMALAIRRPSSVQALNEIFRHKHVFDPGILRRFVVGCISDIVGCTDYDAMQMKLVDAEALHGIPISIGAFDLIRFQTVFITSQNDPGAPLVDTLVASMSPPLLLPPREYRMQDGSTVLLFDGDVCASRAIHFPHMDVEARVCFQLSRGVPGSGYAFHESQLEAIVRNRQGSDAKDTKDEEHSLWDVCGLDVVFDHIRVCVDRLEPNGDDDYTPSNPSKRHTPPTVHVKIPLIKGVSFIQDKRTIEHHVWCYMGLVGARAGVLAMKRLDDALRIEHDR